MANWEIKLFVWPCSNVVQIGKTLVHAILCATEQTNWEEAALHRAAAYCHSTVRCR